MRPGPGEFGLLLIGKSDLLPALLCAGEYELGSPVRGGKGDMRVPCRSNGELNEGANGGVLDGGKEGVPEGELPC